MAGTEPLAVAGMRAVVGIRGLLFVPSLPSGRNSSDAAMAVKMRSDAAMAAKR